jgi:hypothetical protein
MTTINEKLRPTTVNKLRWKVTKPAFQTLNDGTVAEGTETIHYIAAEPGDIINAAYHNGDRPAKTVVLVSGGTKTVVVEDYYFIGQLHRETGPALIRRQLFGKDAVSKIVVAEWYYKGVNLTDLLLAAYSANADLAAKPEVQDFYNTVLKWESMTKKEIKNSYYRFVRAIGVIQ